MNREIHSIIFEGDAVVIAYIELPTDVRVDGRVVMQRQIRAATSHPDYGEDALSLQIRAAKVLANILDDFENSEPYDGTTTDTDDEELGMGERA